MLQGVPTFSTVRGCRAQVVVAPTPTPITSVFLLCTEGGPLSLSLFFLPLTGSQSD